MEKKSDTQHLHEKQIEHGLQHVLSTSDGRAWYYNLITECGIYQAEPLGSSDMMHFQAGKRNVGLKLIGMAEQADPEAFFKMLQEDVNRKKEIDNEHSSNTNSNASKSGSGTDSYATSGFTSI